MPRGSVDGSPVAHATTPEKICAGLTEKKTGLERKSVSKEEIKLNLRLRAVEDYAAVDPEIRDDLNLSPLLVAAAALSSPSLLIQVLGPQ